MRRLRRSFDSDGTGRREMKMPVTGRLSMVEVVSETLQAQIFTQLLWYCSSPEIMFWSPGVCRRRNPGENGVVYAVKLYPAGATTNCHDGVTDLFGKCAVKLYPADATTNSQDGVTDLFGKCVPVIEEMVKQNMPLLVHGEVTNPEMDIFDHEKTLY